MFRYVCVVKNDINSKIYTKTNVCLCEPLPFLSLFFSLVCGQKDYVTQNRNVFKIYLKLPPHINMKHVRFSFANTYSYSYSRNSFFWRSIFCLVRIKKNSISSETKLSQRQKEKPWKHITTSHNCIQHNRTFCIFEIPIYMNYFLFVPVHVAAFLKNFFCGCLRWILKNFFPY